jgi:acetyl esterase/lipase
MGDRMEAHWLLLALATTAATLSTAAMVRTDVRMPAPWIVVGAVTAELAPWIAFAAAAILWLFATYTTALEHEPGRLSALILVSSLAGLALTHSRVRGTRHAVEAALRGELGEDFRESIPLARRTETGRPIPLQRVLQPWPRRPRTVQLLPDIRYPGGHARNTLDVYRATRGCVNAPVLLYLHGNEWSKGHKRRQSLPLLHHLAALGWVIVAPNYRHSPDARFPAQLIDCKCAMAWVRAHIAEYGGDPHWVAVAGGAAGAHLAALLALTFDDAELQPGFEHIDTRPAACVTLYGIYDFICRGSPQRDRRARIDWLGSRIMPCVLESDPGAWEAASPIAQVRPDAPPFLVLHGSHDAVVAPHEASTFAQCLRAVSHAPVVYAELPGAHHRWDMFNSPRALQAVQGITWFLEWCVAPQTVTGPHNGNADRARS